MVGQMPYHAHPSYAYVDTLFITPCGFYEYLIQASVEELLAITKWKIFSYHSIQQQQIGKCQNCTCWCDWASIPPSLSHAVFQCRPLGVIAYQERATG